MITTAIINFIINTFYNIVLAVIGNTALPVLNNITSFIDGFSLSQTFYDIISLCVYFLPMGTVITLFNLTLVIILGKMVLSFVHLITGGVIFSK